MVICNNCHRVRVETQSISASELRKKHAKLYFNMGTLSTSEVSLCQLCKQYLLSDKKANATTYWPAMFWAFLTSRQLSNDVVHLTLEEKWGYLPSQWRLWWFEELNLDMDVPSPRFVLKDTQVDKLKEVVETLEWLSLSRAMDEHMTYPEVRCPWGCGEFLHLTKKVPLEDLLDAKSNGAFHSYAGIRKTHSWVWTIRPDFPTAASILCNDDFNCQPTLTFDTRLGPCILCCNDHDASCRQSYVHVPSSPTGCLFTEQSNQLAQAVIKSRTLRPTKLHTYSDTYETATIMGGYDGLDCCYLMSAGRYVPTNKLAQQRDALSIAGRSDVRTHVLQLPRDCDARNYMPTKNVQDKLRMADALFPNVPQLQSKELAAATFVALDDAISLQEETYNESTQVLKVVDPDTGTSNLEAFDPPWPKRIFRVHPLDGFGERFSAIEDNCDSFVAWTLLGCVMCVPSLWSIASDAIVDNKDPKGYLMSIAWSLQMKAGKGRSIRTNKQFFSPPKDKSKRRTAIGISSANDLVHAQHLKYWQFSQKVLVIRNRWLVEPSFSGQVIILIFDDDLTESTLPVQNGWELRLVITKNTASNDSPNWNGTLCARHGGTTGPSWWRQDIKRAGFVQCCKLPMDATPVQLTKVALAVYVRDRIVTATQNRDRYLRCLGGQTILFCHRHKDPLISTFIPDSKSDDNDEDNNSDHNENQPVDDTPACCCDHPSIANKNRCWRAVVARCLKKAAFSCPRVGCNICVCEQCFSVYADDPKNNRYLLSLSESEFVPSMEPIGEETLQPELFVDTRVDRDAILIDDLPDADEIFFPGENRQHMGPDEAYEFVNNLLDESDSENEEGFDGTLHSVVDELHPAFATATATVEPYEVYLDAPEEVIASPLHVLLNQQGHLLIRRATKLRMRKKHANFFQRIVATSSGAAVPLVYGEAVLFPDIFFYNCPDGSIAGAIPTALWADQHYLSRYGVASMRDHAKTRIKDPSTLCCSDSRYHFMELDCIVNLGLRGKDSRLVLHRGFAERQGKEGASFRQTEGNEELYGDAIENHSNVHKLSALVAESPPHYFYTQSCNQSTCRGLRRLREWVSSDTAKTKVASTYGVSYEEAGTILRKSAAPFVQRSWEVVIDLWMKYIIYSKEEPLHKIDWAWYRKEFQDQAGNPSHIHCILRTMIDISTEEGRMMVLDKIRGGLTDLIRYEELCQMKEDGVIDSINFLKDILGDAVCFLTHSCNSRCQVPKILQNGETVFVCKRPSNWLLTTQPHMQELPVVHSSAALNILLQLGLAETKLCNNRNQIVVIHPLLKMERHIPRCGMNDGKFSPTNGRLFAMMPSSQNIQYCTGASISTYLTSYVTEMDQVAIVLFKPPSSNDPKTIRAEHHSLNNTKISSVRHFQNKKRKIMTKNNKLPSGRPITHMETLTVIQGIPLVKSNRFFIHMPTMPREYRAALSVPYLRSKVRPQDLQAVRAVTGQTVRQQLYFPPNRLFTDDQITVIKDELEAPLKTDQVTYFSMRPPELRFVREQFLYIRWFERSSVCPLFDPAESMTYMKKHLSLQIDSSEWLDGFNHKITLRRAALLPCCEYAQSCPSAYYGTNTSGTKLKRNLVKLLQRLSYLHQVFDLENITRRTTGSSKLIWSQLQSRFLGDYKGRHLPVVWTTPIYPRRRTAFLVHILLSMGSFITEYELMLSGNLRNAFISAGLFDTANPTASINTLLSKYIFERLRATPGSTFQFDRNLTEAADAFTELLLQVESPPQITPSVLYSHMREETNAQIDDFIQGERKRLIDSVYQDLCGCGFDAFLPDKQAVLEARVKALTEADTDRFFPPPRCPKQSIASHVEQTKLLEQARLNVRSYMNPASNHRNIIVVGGPGVGKTTACQFLTLYLLSLGLNVTATSLVADRSKQLGGTHFHRLISLKGSDNGRSPGQLAEAAIRDLYRKPNLLVLLKTLDCLNLDEFGVFSAEMLAILDMTMRYVRGSTQFMGGVLMYCTLDHLQLMPFSGTPAMMSMYVVTEFDFFALNESVRAASDPALQEICKLTRTLTWEDAKKERFRDLLTKHCTFVPSFDDPRLPADAVFVFGRKAPCDAAEEIMLRRMKTLHTETFVVVQAIDEESTTAGNWRKATIPTIQRLGKRIKRRQGLVLYPKAHFEFTYNEKYRFNQGQLGILLSVPPRQQLQEHRSIEVWKAPSGVKEFPLPSNCNPPFLLAEGWIQILVPFSTSRPEMVSRGIQARRTQYGLKPRVSSTIHACMGSTLSSVVTALITQPGNNLNLDFSLWEAAQVVVLLSRTRKACHIFFVGDRNATIDHLLLILQKTHRFLPSISKMLFDLCNEAHVTPIYNQPTAFRPYDALLGSLAGVSLLVSTRNTAYSYIGETKSLTKRLTQHNSGQGPSTTNNRILMPWAIMAYVNGFQNRPSRLRFEAVWKLTARRRSDVEKTAEGLVLVARDLVARHNLHADDKLRLIRCGSIVHS